MPHGAVFGADIGGTFTDIVYAGADGAVVVDKRLSTREDYSRAISEGIGTILGDLGRPASIVSEVRHGTTVATNAILEKTGARAALVTTRGFRDRLEIGRLRIPALYDIRFNKPTPLVPRDRRLEIAERIGAQGEILSRPGSKELDRVAHEIRRLEVTSVAVCFINAYLNDANEVFVREELARRLPAVAFSHSAELLREISEFERTATTVANAYIKPEMGSYLGRLRARLADGDVQSGIFIMQSNGGVLPLTETAEKPVYAIESGPAAGVVGARALGSYIGEPNLVAFDMGGTTAKASLIEHGEISYSGELEVGGEISRNSRLIKGSGYLIRTPTIDISEVGAGGGSIAWIDAGGQLRIGPRSAGSTPGPACYGLGGTEPTVTDANIVLGFMNPVALAGGAVAVSLDRAAAAIRERVAEPLGLSVVEAALGIHKLANASMGRAIRSVSTERGRDIREFTLVAFGGNGAIHAAALARDYGIKRLIVPQRPGVFSAVGLLVADVEQHFVITPPGRASHLDDAIAEHFEAMERDAAVAACVSPEPGHEVTVEWFADLRYLRQGHTLRVPVRRGSATLVAAAFEAEHATQFGHCSPGTPVEVVNVRLIVRKRRADRDAVTTRLFSGQGSERAAAVGAVRTCHFGPALGSGDTVILLGRGALGREAAPGPMVIEEYDTSIVVPPDFAAHRDEHGLVWLTNLNQELVR